MTVFEQFASAYPDHLHRIVECIYRTRPYHMADFFLQKPAFVSHSQNISGAGEALYAAFSWLGTPEGLKYWRALAVGHRNREEQSVTTTVHIKIHLAAEATRSMDELVVHSRVLENLLSAMHVGNGAGIYPDPSRVKSLLLAAKVAIAQAHQIALKTDWPTDEDYDQA